MYGPGRPNPELRRTVALSETLPGLTTTNPDLNITQCLSCHDGNLAEGAMMKNAVYETLPSTYGTYNTIPTLLGNDGTTSATTSTTTRWA